MKLPKKVCNMKNYNNLKNLNQTYCSRNSYNSYKVRVKDKDKQAFHNSKEGHKVMRNIISRDLGLCKVCLSKNKSYLCCTLHNIVKGKQESWIKDKFPVFFM